MQAKNHFCGYGRMEDLGCAVVSEGIVVMREWKIKDAQWKVCAWKISMRLAQREDHSRKYDLCVSLCC